MPQIQSNGPQWWPSFIPFPSLTPSSPAQKVKPQEAPPADNLSTKAKGKAAPALAIPMNQSLPQASLVDIQNAVNTAIDQSYSRVPQRAGESRHALNRRLQATPSESTIPPANHAHYDGSDVVVIAFEGTGAFEPRRAPLMQDAAEILKKQGLSLQGQDSALYDAVSEGISQKENRSNNWSGLGRGPLNGLMNSPELNEKTQWLSFPSEEFEALSGGDAYKDVTAKQLLGEAYNSTRGETPGINQALKAVKDIQAQAKAQGKNPKFVIVTHSSGGRSSVKFLEKAKALNNTEGKQMDFPFVMTIDPVREAHEAVGEALKEIYVNKGTEHNMNRVREAGRAVNDAEIFGFKPFDWMIPDETVKHRKVYAPKVRYTPQDESLYKPHNVGKFINYFQRKDTEGLKDERFRFGIEGSPIKGADANIPIHDVGSAGHGEIAYHDKVVKAFLDGISGL